MTKRKEYNWEELIAEQERSGKSVRSFCREKGMAANLFYVNRKKRKVQEFVEVDIRKKEVQKNPIVLSYRGVRIEIEAGFCREALREALAVIGEIE